MSLTQRIVSAMVLGLLIGGSMNLLFAGEILSLGLETWITKYLIDGLFDGLLACLCLIAQVLNMCKGVKAWMFD